MKAKIDVATVPGTMSGSSTRRKATRRVQRSTIAASSTSFRIPWTNPRFEQPERAGPGRAQGDNAA